MLDEECPVGCVHMQTIREQLLQTWWVQTFRSGMNSLTIAQLPISRALHQVGEMTDDFATGDHTLSPAWRIAIIAIVASATDLTIRALRNASEPRCHSMWMG